MKLGIGKALIKYTPGCFPTDGFVGVHDDSYVRTMVFENEDGSRGALVSLDITGMFDFSVVEFKNFLKENAGVEPENAKICATHNFTSPHMWEVPARGMKDTSIRPGHPQRTEAELESCRQINETVAGAFQKAVLQAVSNIKEARSGAAAGTCAINTNRNMETKEGWWTGADAEGYSDHIIPVIRFDDAEGKPMGMIFSFDCQSSVMGKTQRREGGKLVTSDLLGHASLFVEKEYGENFIAMALCGACGDQEPMLKATRSEVDLEGNLRTVDIHEDGFALLEAEGARLGAEVLKAAQRVNASENPKVIFKAVDFTAKTKKMDRNLKNLKPVRFYEYIENGEKEVQAGIVSIGEFAIVATQAEMASITAHKIRVESPYKVTAVANMVDGGAKYMMDSESYDLFQYGAMNSMFMKGTAEKLQEEAVKVLKECHESQLL